MFLQIWKGQLPNVSECEPHNVVACCCLFLLFAVSVSAAGPGGGGALLLLPAMVVLLLLLPYSPVFHHFYACIEEFVLATFAKRHSCQTGLRVLALHCRVQ